MALIPNFSASQTIGASNTINLSDTSTGTDGTIVNRIVTIQDAYGQYYTASGVSKTLATTNWVYSNSSIAIACLPYDLCPSILVQWVDGSGTVVYSKTIDFPFVLYGVAGSFTLSQSIVSNKAILQDTNYWMNRVILSMSIQDAQDAVSIMDNIGVGQSAADRETYMLANQNVYF